MTLYMLRSIIPGCIVGLQFVISRFLWLEYLSPGFYMCISSFTVTGDHRNLLCRVRMREGWEGNTVWNNGMSYGLE
jgi:hypothetical protein